MGFIGQEPQYRCTVIGKGGGGEQVPGAGIGQGKRRILGDVIAVSAHVLVFLPPAVGILGNVGSL